jgi:hypothetical protein
MRIIFLIGLFEVTKKLLYTPALFIQFERLSPWELVADYIKM